MSLNCIRPKQTFVSRRPVPVRLTDLADKVRIRWPQVSVVDVARRHGLYMPCEAPLSLTVLSHTLMATTAWGAARSMTPYLLSLGGSTDMLARTLNHVPIVGSLLSPLLSRGGVLGVAVSAATLFSCVQALMGQQPGTGRGAAWALAQACLGMCLSPLWMMVAAGTTPSSIVAVGLALGCIAMVSTLLNESVSGVATTQPMALSAAFGILAGAPVMAELAQGTDVKGVTGQIILTLAMGALVGAGMVAQQYYANLTSSATSFLQRAAVTHCADHRLNLLGEKKPTVFIDATANSALVEELKSMRANTLNNIPLGMRKVLMHGPPGTGKTVTAQAIAHWIHGELFAPRVGEILMDKQPAQRVMRYFDEALVRTRKTRRPVVLFFDESEKLFAQRQGGVALSEEQRQMHTLVDVFNGLLDGVHQFSTQNIVVVVATNHFADLDVSIKQRFRVLTMAMPSHDTVKCILVSKWAQAQAEVNLAAFLPYVPKAGLLADLADGITRKGWSGREIYSRMQYACRKVSGDYAELVLEHGQPNQTWFMSAMDAAVLHYLVLDGASGMPDR
jgi:hypothetical protein